MRGLAGLWLWGGLERTRGKQREGRGLGWYGFDEGKLARLEGEGKKGKGPEGGRGAAVAPRWRLNG